MNRYGNENNENDKAMEVEDSRKTENISTPSTPSKQGTKRVRSEQATPTSIPDFPNISSANMTFSSSERLSPMIELTMAERLSLKELSMDSDIVYGVQDLVT